MKIYHDCESVGLMGPTKLHQFSIDGGPVQFIPMFRGWETNSGTREALGRLLDLLYRPDTIYVGFNVSFDMFHLYRCAHRLIYGLPYNSSERPAKPFLCKTLDLQVHAMLKSPLAPFAFSRSRSRSVATVRKIPVQAEEYVKNLIEPRLKKFVPNGFELTCSKHEVKDRKDLISLSWAVVGGLSLKKLMAHYGLKTMKIDEVWPLPTKGTESPWLPYPDPSVHSSIEVECDQVMLDRSSPFWRYSELDVLYLQILEQKLGCPGLDHHSSCAHAVAYTRYYGFDVNRARLEQSRAYYQNKLERIEQTLAGVDLKSPKQRLEFLKPFFPLLASTKKQVLANLATLAQPGSDEARSILEYGSTRQRLMQIDKVAECRTGKAHPELRVMGTATGRMAGSAGLNWQGIGQPDLLEPEDTLEPDLGDELDEMPDEFMERVDEEEVRDEEEENKKIGLRSAICSPMVGDFSSFEVCIAARVYADEQLQRDLNDGVDLHSMTTALFHPKLKDSERDYDRVRSLYLEHDPRMSRYRKQMKSIVFKIFYFASAMKVADQLGFLPEQAEAVLDNFYGRYGGIRRYREDIERRFITADTEDWTADSVSKMDRGQTDLTGFSRRWDFEAELAATMWELGHTRIRSGCGGVVTRQEQKGKQTVDQAIKSALLGSAIAVQAAVSRQAGNMPVQATGANLTKKLMSELWEVYRVPCMNIHDELVFSHHPNFNSPRLGSFIDKWVEEHKSVVPSLEFKYDATEYWSDK